MKSLFRKAVENLTVGAALLCAFVVAAVAQNFWYAPGNQTVGGQVQMGLNGSNQAVPLTGGGFGVNIQGNGTGTTGAVVGTLAAVAGKTAYICGFNVAAVGSGAVGPITIAGLLGGSQVWQLTAGATGASVGTTYSPCLPASAVNTNITITTTADASATAVDVNSWGYNL